MSQALFRLASVCSLAIVFFATVCKTSKADGPNDNRADAVRPMPPPGIPIDAAQRTMLEGKLADLTAQIEALRQKKDERVQKYLPDVEIFAKSVHIALHEDGFFEPKDVDHAFKLLEEGASRGTQLEQGKTPWSMNNGSLSGSVGVSFITVRGFRSKIDGSVQPYGVVYSNDQQNRVNIRADVWCRGRSEKGLELQFLAQRMSNREPNPAPGVLMIHPFGRYCNANKLAGEVDTLEALEHALSEYPINPKRVSIRGFSMGGAAAWHLAVHYPDRWFAANPGAGFSETPKFLNVFQSEKLEPSAWEQTLWKLYDCPEWALNLRNLPTIAYSGELDKQKQAADVMAEACWSLPENWRFELTHLVAPKTAHKVDPVVGKEMERRLAMAESLAKHYSGNHVWFTTQTLKYNRCRWLEVDALESHWSPGTISASLQPKSPVASITLFTQGIEGMTLRFDADQLPIETEVIEATIVEKNFAPQVIRFHRQSDWSWSIRLVRERSENGIAQWKGSVPHAVETGLRKKKDLQGPIDDAFMGPFLFVKPDAKGQHPAVDAWVESEMQRAIREWHRQMRGDIRVVRSDELKESDLENHHIVLWGDPKSNSKLKQLLEKLPMVWTETELSLTRSPDEKWDSASHVPAMIYPNPLAPNRYIVLNSGLTYREYDYLNNARQVPKLPDWAILDIRTPPNARYPGKVSRAGFFGEHWE